MYLRKLSASILYNEVLYSKYELCIRKKRKKNISHPPVISKDFDPLSSISAFKAHPVAEPKQRVFQDSLPQMLSLHGSPDGRATAICYSGTIYLKCYPVTAHPVAEPEQRTVHEG